MTAFLPVIGVIIGFLLSWIKDIIQNKSKISMNIKHTNTGFNYYVSRNVEDLVAIPSEADYLSLDLVVDVFNSGKGNTAIKDILIKVQVNEEERFFQPAMRIDKNENIDYSFNLPSNSIRTLSLNLNIKREEDELFEEIFFHDDVSFLPEDQNRLLFTVIIRDIHEKEYQLVIEPISILRAGEILDESLDSR